jgi:aromatic ring hydroxylase
LSLKNSAVTLDKDKAKDFTIVFIAPMDSPGVKLICRPSYEMNLTARSTIRCPAGSMKTMP